MTREGNPGTASFEALRTGFIFSLLSLCLLLLIGTGFRFSYAFALPASYNFFVFLEYIFPFVILFFWVYGAHKRVEGWNQLGQKTIADKLSLSWKINLFFILPLPFFVFFLAGFGGGLYFLLSPFSPLLWAVETCLVWGYSTVYEASGLKKMNEEKKIRLGLSRTCSLAAIFAYALFIVVGYVALATQPSFPGFLVFAFLPFYFSVLSNAIVLASPLLIISCINVIVQLKGLSDRQTRISDTSSG